MRRINTPTGTDINTNMNFFTISCTISAAPDSNSLPNSGPMEEPILAVRNITEMVM